MKKILLVILILFITGCDVDYNLTITEKHMVKENFVISVDGDDVYDSKNSMDEFLDHYSYIYSSYNEFKTYNIKTKKSEPSSYFIVDSQYKSLENYIESHSFKSMFLSAEILDTGKYLSFTTSRNDYLYNLKNGTVLLEDGKFDSFQINIKFYNEVVDHNADKVDKSNNIYTWYVDENKTPEDSYIYFKLGPKVKYFVKFKDFIMNNLASIIAVSTILIAIGFAIIYIIYKSKKNNEI